MAETPSPAAAPDSVGITERLGEKVPLELTLRDETGAPITLGEAINGVPTFLNLVYYRCPGICSPFLGEVAHVIKETPMTPGLDFRVVSVSFEPTETPALAQEKKTTHLNLLGPDFPPDAWRFLTGDAEAIAALTAAVGFQYQKTENDYAHATALITLAPDGEIIRYLFGKTFLPFDLKMAVVEANAGRTGPTINKVLQYCFSYDPEGRRYVFNLLQVAGTGVVVLVAGLVAWLVVQDRRRRRDLGANG